MYLKSYQIQSLIKKPNSSEIELKGTRKCSECNGSLIFPLKSSVLTCERCGLVIEDEPKYVENYVIENRSDFTNRNGIQYVSLGKTVDSVINLGSNIGHRGEIFFKDSNSNRVSSNTQQLFKRLKKNYWVSAKIEDTDITTYRIFRILNDIKSYLDLSKYVKDRAAYFYRKIIKYEKRIRNHVSLIAFCIFYASREESQNSPISLGELCDIFQKLGHRVNSRLIIRDTLQYQSILGKKNVAHHSNDFLQRYINQIINSAEFINWIHSKHIHLEVEKYTQLLLKTSVLILKELSKTIKNGRNPVILAGTTIYCADKIIAKKNGVRKLLTQKIVSRATGIAEYSIRDHFVKIFKPIFGV